MTYGNQGYPGGYQPYGPNQPGGAPGPDNQGNQGNPPGQGEEQPFDPFAPQPTYRPTPPPTYPGFPGYQPPQQAQPQSAPPAQQPYLSQPPPPSAPPLGSPPESGPPAPSDPTGFGAGPSQLYFPPKPPKKRSRAWLKVLAGFGVTIVLAGLLVGSYLLVKGTGGAPQAHGSHSAAPASATERPSPTRSPLDIGSRATDSKPLTASEVFPGTTIQPDPGRSTTYPVLKVDKVVTNCASVANGQIPAVLTKYGCDQVVRATLATTDDKYAFTAGICNLSDAAGAQTASDTITSLGQAQKGGFDGLAASGAAAKLDKSPTLYAVSPDGHYLIYIVIGLASGATPAVNAATQQIVQDVAQTYLTGVIDQRKNAGD